MVRGVEVLHALVPHAAQGAVGHAVVCHTAAGPARTAIRVLRWSIRRTRSIGIDRALEEFFPREFKADKSSSSCNVLIRHW